MFPQAWAVFYDCHHGADFSRRATCDGDEGKEFGSSGTLEALDYVIRDGEGGAVELVAKSGRERQSGRFEQIQSLVVESRRFALHREVFEAFVFDHSGKWKMENGKGGWN
jgi:hypothetical protein